MTEMPYELLSILWIAGPCLGWTWDSVEGLYSGPYQSPCVRQSKVHMCPFGLPDILLAVAHVRSPQSPRTASSLVSQGTIESCQVQLRELVKKLIPESIGKEPLLPIPRKCSRKVAEVVGVCSSTVGSLEEICCKEISESLIFRSKPQRLHQEIEKQCQGIFPLKE